MKFSLFIASGTLSTMATAYCRYRIRSYDNDACSGNALNDAYLDSRSCFDLKNGSSGDIQTWIWIDSVDGTDYCKNGNWIREYANFFHGGSCSNNNRGQQNVAMESCEKLGHTGTDSIRINYA